MVSKRSVLESLVSHHDRESRPVAAARLADRLGAETAAVRDRLDALGSYGLVKRGPDGDGYVPTITAHELLKLDVDEESVLIIESPD